MTLSSTLELNAALDRFRQRGRPLEPIKAVVGDGNGVVFIKGTNKIVVELFERGSQMLAQAVLGKFTVTEGQVVDVAPLEDRAPSMLRVLGRDQSNCLVFGNAYWMGGRITGATNGRMVDGASVFLSFIGPIDGQGIAVHPASDGAYYFVAEQQSDFQTHLWRIDPDGIAHRVDNEVFGLAGGEMDINPVADTINIHGSSSNSHRSVNLFTGVVTSFVADNGPIDGFHPAGGIFHPVTGHWYFSGQSSRIWRVTPPFSGTPTATSVFNRDALGPPEDSSNSGGEPSAMAFNRAGTVLYFWAFGTDSIGPDGRGPRLYRVDLDANGLAIGSATLLAGGGLLAFSEGMLATNLTIDILAGIAVNECGSVYISCGGGSFWGLSNRLLKLDEATLTLSTIAFFGATQQETTISPQSLATANHYGVGRLKVDRLGRMYMYGQQIKRFDV